VRRGRGEEYLEVANARFQRLMLDMVREVKEVYLYGGDRFGWSLYYVLGPAYKEKQR
jgi:hypothetical protein